MAIKKSNALLPPTGHKLTRINAGTPFPLIYTGWGQRGGGYRDDDGEHAKHVNDLGRR